MCQIFILLVFQLFYTSQILGSDHCDSTARYESYLDAAVDMINKAKSFAPENVTFDAYPTVTQNKTTLSIECAKVLQRCQNHSITVSHEKACRPMDCEEVLLSGHNHSGVYTIWPRNRLTDGKSLEVYCDMDTDDGGWTVIQRRGDFNKPRLFFYKDWSSYKNGFGDIEEDFWLGNDNIFALTNQREYSVRFDLKTKKGEKFYALYDTFWIDDEDRKYTLHIRNYSGDAGNSMTKHHSNQKFSTKDQDNDGSEENLSQVFKGGWWYGNSVRVNLNGVYRKDQLSVDGIIWLTITRDSESLIATEMKIRSINFK